MREPAEILASAFQRVSTNLDQPFVRSSEIRERVEYVSRNLKNRAGARLLLACLLAKTHNPALDVRKPYTQIGSDDSFSGRTYDERYLSPFISTHDLPCNTTTAFLTPALRNRNETLVPNLDLVGRPPKLYVTVLQLLDDVHENRITAETLLAETVRWLVIVRNERRKRIESLLDMLRTTEGDLPLSSEEIITLVEQHLRLKGTSRLPVLLIAAAYQAAGAQLGECVRDLYGHNAADIQTGALGDVEIMLTGEDNVVTSYEMKDKPVSHEDINRALQKLALSKKRIDNYIFITTAAIAPEVQRYAQTLYAQTGGIEFVILDCIGFVQHFVHLFHRLRIPFLEAYQALILAEPDSSISQPVKEAFLSMRQAAEAG